MVSNRPRKLMVFHSCRNSAFGVQASTSIEHWGTGVDTQTEKPGFWIEGTWNFPGKQVLCPQTNAMTQEVLPVKSSDSFRAWAPQPHSGPHQQLRPSPGI